MPFQQGPHLLAALICEQVIERKDGVLSLINIVDRWTVQAQGPNPPEKMPPFSLQANLVVIFAADQAQGAQSVELKLQDAMGLLHELGSRDIHLEPGRTHNMISRMELELSAPGRYWIWIYVEGEFVTKVPLELIYLRARSIPAPSSEPPHSP
jgi:hypothetical protein